MPDTALEDTVQQSTPVMEKSSPKRPYLTALALGSLLLVPGLAGAVVAYRDIPTQGYIANCGPIIGGTLGIAGGAFLLYVGARDYLKRPTKEL